MKCPKCRAASGDDWSQCRENCSMPGSPHYTEKSLACREREFTKNMGPSEQAKRLYPKLLDLVEEYRHKLQRATTRASYELLELECEHIAQAAELLRVLETEQFRQREIIRHYLDNRAGTADLRSVSHSWNGDAS